jgi:hypothetical protein
MLNRRTLFARLTAVAMAPLAKWLPKEPVLQSGMFIGSQDAMFVIGRGISLVSDGTVIEIDDSCLQYLSPVPQEEA